MRKEIPTKTFAIGKYLTIYVQGNEIITGIDWHYTNITGATLGRISTYNFNGNMKLYTQPDGDCIMDQGRAIYIKGRNLSQIAEHYRIKYDIPEPLITTELNIRSPEDIQKIASSIGGISYPKGLKLYTTIDTGLRALTHDKSICHGINQIYTALDMMAKRHGFWCPATFHLLP